MDKGLDKKLNKRLGWILFELGKEDSEIAKLKDSLLIHIGRRTGLQSEGNELCERLGMDVDNRKPKILTVVLWKEQAAKIETEMDLRMVGDGAGIITKVRFEKLSAEGRRKILVTIILD